MTTYIHENIEVKLTGRTASKKGREKRKRRTDGDNTAPVAKKLLHEVTPADKDIGEWKKWVDLETLFTIDDEDDQYDRHIS